MKSATCSIEMSEVVEEEGRNEVAIEGRAVDGGGMIIVGKLAKIVKVESISISSNSSAIVGESRQLDIVTSDE